MRRTIDIDTAVVKDRPSRVAFDGYGQIRRASASGLAMHEQMLKRAKRKYHLDRMMELTEAMGGYERERNGEYD